ncbi:MAG TPA: hypothetical protein VGO91_18230 [Pyrinomonadaceae bacterium]|jgi:hypothetical protein|nr:hypothetical protein [Pyrinomonadaceae bacterium]
MEHHQLRKNISRFLIALLTFSMSVIGVSYYRDYQRPREELLWRESRLRRDLFYLRRSLDEYAAEKGALPQSLDDLVKADYLTEVPFDPITHRRAWKIVVGNYPNALQGQQGIIDVHSTSAALSLEGAAYEDW